MFVIGTIKRGEVKQFRVECKKLGWIVLSTTGNLITYLDRSCNKHTLDVGNRTSLVLIGG